MSVAKTVDVDVDVSDVECDECEEKAKYAFCGACLELVKDDAAENALSGYSPPEDESRTDAAERLRSWLLAERAKPATDITPEVAALFERCAEDLEVG